jgi:hypothetical protein
MVSKWSRSRTAGRRPGLPAEPTYSRTRVPSGRGAPLRRPVRIARRGRERRARGPSPPGSRCRPRPADERGDADPAAAALDLVVGVLADEPEERGPPRCRRDRIHPGEGPTAGAVQQRGPQDDGPAEVVGDHERFPGAPVAQELGEDPALGGQGHVLARRPSRRSRSRACPGRTPEGTGRAGGRPHAGRTTRRGCRAAGRPVAGRGGPAGPSGRPRRRRYRFGAVASRFRVPCPSRFSRPTGPAGHGATVRSRRSG